ncbi:signal-regulatory protein beta-1-like isoform X2 [Pungitius pungitius]|uniref:signal-regulatory protein beta-1-like isoform X2 n=1 Tax=Pungitius pungitius TaxID=134920 RepID=UPI002E164D5B
MSHLCLLLLLAGQVAAAPDGLRVRQQPPSLRVTRGDTATLSCHFKVEALRFGVQWFRLQGGRRLVPGPPRTSVAEKENASSLVIAEVALEDSGWYYCEVNVLQRDPECGNGTELLVWAPPSAPKIYLQIPPEPPSGEWALVCLTGGFHPSQLTLTWTSRGAAGNTESPSVSNCTLPALSLGGNASAQLDGGAPLSPDWSVNSRCFQVTDNHTREAFLLSVIVLPRRGSLEAGITFTCAVQDHPAMTALMAASFTWDASPNELIVHLNILKMCLLSAMTVFFLFEAVKHFSV